MPRNVKIKAITYRFLHVCGPRLSLCGRKASEIDGQRGDLFIIKTTSHHLHHRMFHIPALIGVHHCGEHLGIETVDRWDASVDTFLAVTGDTFTRQICSVADIRACKKGFRACSINA